MDSSDLTDETFYIPGSYLVRIVGFELLRTEAGLASIVVHFVPFLRFPERNEVYTLVLQEVYERQVCMTVSRATCSAVLERLRQLGFEGHRAEHLRGLLGSNVQADCAHVCDEVCRHERWDLPPQKIFFDDDMEVEEMIDEIFSHEHPGF